MGFFDRIRTLLGGDTATSDSAASPEWDGDDTGADIETSPNEPNSDDSESVTVPSEDTDIDQVSPGVVIADRSDELRAEAEEVTEFWDEYDLDFTPASFASLDAVFASQQANANYLQIELEDGRTGTLAPLASSPACYFGETMVRTYAATWVFDEDFGWALQFSDGTVVNLFGAIHRALDTDPPFVNLHDTLVDQFGLDGAPINPESDLVTIVSVDDGIEPDDVDDTVLTMRQPAEAQLG